MRIELYHASSCYYQQYMKTKMVVPIAILVGGIIVAIAVYSSTSQRVENTPKKSNNPAAILPVTAYDHILGNPSAPVKIIEYSDFECHYCAQFQKTLHRIINSYGPTGRVAWIFREFPLTEIHPNALQAARAAECVARTAGNAAFWSFADALFANQPVISSDIGKYAYDAGAKPTSVASCMISGSVNKRIDRQRANAIAAGAAGTPYALIVVSGTTPVVIDGAYPYSYIKQQIETALNIASSTEKTSIK